MWIFLLVLQCRLLTCCFLLSCSLGKCVVSFSKHMLDKNTVHLFLNSITLAKTLQSPLPTVSGYYIFTLSCHVCSFLFIPPSLLCTFSSVHQRGATPVGISSPHQKALFTLRDLGEPAVLQASPDSREECDRAGELYRAPTILTTLTSSESSLNQGSCANRCLKLS